MIETYPLLPAVERGTEVCSIHPPGRRLLPFPRRPWADLLPGPPSFFVDKLPHLLSTFHLADFRIRFAGASAQASQDCVQSICGNAKKYLLCQTFLLSYIRLHPKGCERNKRDAYAETVQRGKPTCYGHADKISPYVYSTRRKNVRYHQNRRQAIQSCRR